MDYCLKFLTRTVVRVPVANIAVVQVQLGVVTVPVAVHQVAI